PIFWQQKNVPFTWVSWSRFHSSSLTSSAAFVWPKPALLTSTSLRSFARRATASASLPISVSRVTSVGTTSAFPPIARRTSSSLSLRRLARTSWAPAAAKCSANARPMPSLAPVTTIRRSSSRNEARGSPGELTPPSLAAARESGFSRRAIQVFPDLPAPDAGVGWIDGGTMADSAKGAPSGVGSALVLILLLTGIAIWQFPLESIRPPASRATPVDRIAALQDIPARLWQARFLPALSPKATPEPGALRPPNGVGEIVSEYLRSQRPRAALEVEILAVLVNGGRPADAAENRLRTRYSVVA